MFKIFSTFNPLEEANKVSPPIRYDVMHIQIPADVRDEVYQRARQAFDSCEYPPDIAQRFACDEKLSSLYEWRKRYARKGMERKYFEFGSDMALDVIDTYFSSLKVKKLALPRVPEKAVANVEKAGKMQGYLDRVERHVIEKDKEFVYLVRNFSPPENEVGYAFRLGCIATRRIIEEALRFDAARAMT